MPGWTRGHLVPGCPKYIHIVPLLETDGNRAHEVAGLDCWCEPMVLVSFKRSDGMRFILVGHHHDQMQIAEQP